MSGGPLVGAVAIVTGASSGIGEATARALAAHGAAVVLAARRIDRLDRLVTELGDRSLAVATDVADPSSCEALVARAVGHFGRLDVLVNNAGVMLIGPFVGAPAEEWRRMVEVNVMGVLHCTAAALPHLLASAAGPRGVADIVNVGSVAGRKVNPGGTVYSATKFALSALSDGLRQELAGRRVRVSLVEPGLTDTELTTHIRPPVLDAMRDALAQMPVIPAAAVAETIAFCVTRPAGVSIGDLIVRPTRQER